jgi:predicted pyridoxine 5'-phosphate oxidase superfamily flavin-nucleotide-binding protein
MTGETRNADHPRGWPGGGRTTFVRTPDACDDAVVTSHTQGTDERAGRLYGDGARALQDTFDSRRLADALSAGTVHDALHDDDVGLIRRQSTVWIATVDADGWPDVSYKGGDVGFVEVVDPAELRIPVYDGNGMWRTLGNIGDDDRIALLFIDVERPWRLRLHGRASVSIEPADIERHVGAQAVIIVRVGRVFPNCGRYIHREGVISTFVPRRDRKPPIPDWKRIRALRTMLPARDQEALERDEGSGDGRDGSSA